MLKCLLCDREYPEEFSKHQCPKCSNDNFHTQLYSTRFPPILWKETPLEFYGDLALKREDQNPFGCFKDRKSHLISHLISVKPLALASCGNQAYSLMKTSNPLAHRTALYLPTNIKHEKFKVLQGRFESINFVDRILTADELSENGKRWNTTNGMDPIGASAYYTLGFELEKENFDNILVPCGSGELYASLAAYFHLLRNNGHISISPITSTLPEADAINTLYRPMDPFLKYFHETFDEEQLICDDDAESLKYYSEKYNCDFSSAVVFDVYEKSKDFIKGKTCLVVSGAKK